MKRRAFLGVIFLPIVSGFKLSDLISVKAALPKDGTQCVIYAEDYDTFVAGPIAFSATEKAWIDPISFPKVNHTWRPKPNGPISHWVAWEKSA